MKKLSFLATLLLCLLFSASSWAININTASAEALAKELSGVGIIKAEAIVSFRERNGPYKSLADLMNVKGIGANTVEKNSEIIHLK